MQSQSSKGFSEALALAYTTHRVLESTVKCFFEHFCLPPSPLALLNVSHFSLLFLISQGSNSLRASQTFCSVMTYHTLTQSSTTFSNFMGNTFHDKNFQLMFSLPDIFA